MNKKAPILLIAALLLPAALYAQQWQPKTAVLMTRFAKTVDPNHVLAEYPRPQLVREKWLNLNGLWQYQPGTGADEAVPAGVLSSTILVPFPVESALSGVMEHHERLWYRRKFTVPAGWAGQHILLHFGAVDYESEVYVNGKSVGVHDGGYDPFSFDITPFITGSGEQEITVRVFDPTDNAGFPRGKQTLHPGGIMYTSTTGIWQTVWLEPVPQNGIDDIKIVPDVDHSVLHLTVTVKDGDGLTVIAKVKDDKTLVKTAYGKANSIISIPVPNAKLWSPNRPFLYDLAISLKKGGKPVDAVSSYFGMRKISIEQVGRFKKIFLNNKFVFQLGPLDQGFWPDGIYTAPSDAAIRNDLQTIKSLGFNMVRKHIKVEPYRWYYWADKLGLMIWQDMPSPDSYSFSKNPPPVDTAAFSSQLTRLVQTHWNSPCIVMWVIFNEGQGQQNTPGYVKMVRALDPSRLINQASGGNYFGVGDILDIHSYPPPGCLLSDTQAVVDGEYGGIGYSIKGHLWHKGFGYITMYNQKDYDSLYSSYARDLTAYKSNLGLNAGVYTQTTDVETEINGLMTYDRALIKGDPAVIRKANENAINQNLILKYIVPPSDKITRSWKYVFSKPDSIWYKKGFDDNAWSLGEGGFGTKSADDQTIRTTWASKEIWLRQEFTIDNLSATDRDNLVLYLHHSNDCQVYLNGVKAGDIGFFTSGYTVVAVSKQAAAALVNGKNVIAIHCSQGGGKIYFDAGLAVLNTGK